MENTNQNDLLVLAAAHRAWADGSKLRQSRLRNKNFTYGRQLDDLVTLPDGTVATERDAILASGKEPLTNNLMRQLVKSVVGRFRQINTERISKIAESNPALFKFYQNNHLAEMDARSIEEFLISGVCIQKVDMIRKLNCWKLGVENVSPNRFFINAVTSPTLDDCEIVGQIYDMSVAEIILRLASGNRALATRIREIYSHNINARTSSIRRKLGFDDPAYSDFWTPVAGKCRVYEIWTRETREILRVHDYRDGTLRCVNTNEAAAIRAEQQRRHLAGESPIEFSWGVEQFWHCRWMSPAGVVLLQYDSPFAHRSHPFAIKLYPLTDGEVHAFMEDVIDQQKYINRLVSLIDHVMSSSAKGVLLYPTSAVPAGMSWENIRQRWSSPSGVIPFDSTSGDAPRQVISNSAGIGAYELLSLEMKLFDEISGVTGALRGRDSSTRTGAELYKEQTKNATVVLLDIFETFAHMQSQRDNLILSA